MMSERKKQPTYVMVPRKLIIAWLTLYSVLFIGILASFQYANYVDRHSNQRWCGVVSLFNEAYKESPPTTPLGERIASEMLGIQSVFKCK